MSLHSLQLGFLYHTQGCLFISPKGQKFTSLLITLHLPWMDMCVSC